MKKHRIIRRAAAFTLSLALAASGLIIAPSADAAAKKPTLAKKVSVAVKKSIKLKINKNSYTIKKVTAKTSDKKIATVKASKSAITIKGVKNGSAVITTTIKAVKGKKDKAKTIKIKTKVNVTKESATETPAPTEAPVVDESVSTQDELNAALANKKARSITISEQSTNLTIPEGKYNVDLIVDAPNATIINEGTFKSITINRIAMNTWRERGADNMITVAAAETVHIVVETVKNILGILFSGENQSSSGRHKVELKSGKVGKIEVENKDAKIDITAEGSAEVSAVNVGAEASVNLSASGDSKVGEVNITADADISVTSDGNSAIDTVKIEGNPSVSVSGTSNNKTNLDIKEAGKTASVIVNTASVTVSSSDGSDAKAIINNQSGKEITVQVTDAGGGTTQISITSSDGSTGNITTVISAPITVVDLSDEEKILNEIVSKIKSKTFNLASGDKSTLEIQIGDIVNPIISEYNRPFNGRIGVREPLDGNADITVEYVDPETKNRLYERSVTIQYTTYDGTVDDQLKNAIHTTLAKKPNGEGRPSILYENFSMTRLVTIGTETYTIIWTAQGQNDEDISSMLSINSTEETDEYQSFSLSFPEDNAVHYLSLTGTVKYTVNNVENTVSDTMGFTIYGKNAPWMITQNLELTNEQDYKDKIFGNGVSVSAVKEAYKDAKLRAYSSDAGATGVQSAFDMAIDASKTKIYEAAGNSGGWTKTGEAISNETSLTTGNYVIELYVDSSALTSNNLSLTDHGTTRPDYVTIYFGVKAE